MSIVKPNIAGVHLRDRDLDPEAELHLVAKIFRICAGVMALLAVGQIIVWVANHPPGNIGLGLLIGDTIRLIVFAALLVAIGDFASVMIKTHYDMRATRVLLAREVSMLREMGVAQGWLKDHDGDHRRADEPTDPTSS